MISYAWCPIRVLPLVLAFFSATFPTVQAGTLAQFRTVVGNFDVELFDQDKPETVKNFIRYVDSGAFTNFQIIHRWVPGFVFQGGGVFVTNRGKTNEAFRFIPNYEAITNEYSVGPRYSNVYGTIAMARSTGTNSATSQWFVNLGDNSALDADKGGFTVFGRVIQGTNVLNKFSAPFTNNIYRLTLQSPLNELPVNQHDVTNNLILFNSLLYVDITLLKVEVKQMTSGASEVSWNSVSNKLNIIEYTTNFPPVWNTLNSTNGDGSRFTVTDPGTAQGKAFYRVRVVP